ncbi:MAG: hypothetical protein EOO01_34145, partial [Chitinophagaceae bacterium]
MLIWVAFSYASALGQSGLPHKPQVNHVERKHKKTTKLFTIDSKIPEASGLVLWNGLFWTHNDSGRQAALFAVDTTTGAIKKTFTFSGVVNRDWEELTQDDDYFYLGDIG